MPEVAARMNAMPKVVSSRTLALPAVPPPRRVPPSRVPAAPRLDAPTATLDAELNARVDPQAQRYWTSLMKGEAAFRGVPMAGIRASVRHVWVGHGLAAWPVGDLLALAQRWFAGPDAETQLAAVLLLAEHAAGRLMLDHADALAAPLERGHLRDWNVTDWYATKALHAFLMGGDAGGGELEARARALAGWATAPTLWQRRAGLVAFVKLAPRAAAGAVPAAVKGAAREAERLSGLRRRSAGSGFDTEGVRAT